MSLRLCATAALVATCVLPASGLAAADARVPFQVGETLTYDVSYSNLLTAGRATLRVVDRQRLSAGRSGYTLQVEAQSVSVAATLYKLYYKLESVLDTASLAAVRAASYSNEGGRERLKSISFGASNTANVEMRTKDIVRSTVTLPPHTLDILSAIYVMRALSARPGDTLTLPVIDGDVVSRLRLTFGAKEVVTTGRGRLPGWRVTPVILDARGQPAPGRRLTFWLSDDAARVPLRFEAALPIGAITLTLAK